MNLTEILAGKIDNFEWAQKSAFIAALREAELNEGGSFDFYDLAYEVYRIGCNLGEHLGNHEANDKPAA